MLSPDQVGANPSMSMNHLIRRELASEGNAAGSVTEARCEVLPHSVEPSASVSPTASMLWCAARVQELLEREHRREDHEREDEIRAAN